MASIEPLLALPIGKHRDIPITSATEQASRKRLALSP